MMNAEVIRTDVLRKELLNMEPTQRHLDDFGQGIYSDDMTGRTYDRAFDIAAVLIKNNKSVIIDASFKRRADRARAVALATSLGIDYYVIECTCPEEIVKERLAKRMREGADASDGRWKYTCAKNQTLTRSTKFRQDIIYGWTGLWILRSSSIKS